ncbi:MAG: hypothetical protein RLZ10_2571 [Bacteroidota bacterium]|jgi:hypothetical protein
MKTFKHSGDLGDIIYSLPTIRGLGGGILYLDPDGGEQDYWVKRQCLEGKTRLTKSTIEFVSPIIKAQPYIEDVRLWKHEKVDYNLDEFRDMFANPNKRSKSGNLADLHLEKFGLPFSEVEKPWLEVKDVLKLNKVIISRSPRVQGGYGWLNSQKYFLRDNAIFVGLPKEHEFFEWTFGIRIPYRQTDSVMELAAIIKGAPTFIGNSSFPLSLAIGMGHPSIMQEVDPKVPTTVFENIKTMGYF